MEVMDKISGGIIQKCQQVLQKSKVRSKQGYNGKIVVVQWFIGLVVWWFGDLAVDESTAQLFGDGLFPE